jgi:hypothetical protein
MVGVQPEDQLGVVVPERSHLFAAGLAAPFVHLARLSADHPASTAIARHPGLSPQRARSRFLNAAVGARGPAVDAFTRSPVASLPFGADFIGLVSDAD